MQRNNIISSYPLTDVQKGLLFEIECSRYSIPVYIIQNFFEIHINFSHTFFIKAFNTVIDRHEILRSAILYNFINPKQIIYERAEIPYKFFDYASLSTEEKLKLFDDFQENDRKCAIDLAKPPLMRLAIFKFNDANYRLIWTRHHVLMGGASVEILINEIFTIYHSLLRGDKWNLPEPTSYEKTLGLVNQLNNENFKNYWLNTLSEYSNATFLPTLPGDKKRIKNINHLYEKIEGEYYSQLINFVEENFLTINNLLEGALGILLSHYTDSDKIIYGAVRAYPKDKVNNCVGLFINTLPVCFEVNNSMKLIDYLQDIKQRNKLLREYINAPLNKIKEWCNLPGDTPLFQCIIDYKPRSLNTILSQHFSASKCTTTIKLDVPYPLVFEIINEGNSLQINLHYDRGLFEDYYAASLLQHFKNILIRLISSDVIDMSDIPTILEYDLAKIADWNDTEAVYPAHKTIHQLFEEQVQKTPAAIAVCYANQTLTYQELNWKANQLAHYLIGQGVGIETPVAIYLKPSLNMMVAVLGVLKAGGVYIPIDTQYPPERILYIFQDSQPAVIITYSEQSNLLNQVELKKLFSYFILVNIDAQEWVHYSNINPALSMQPTNGMYTIYTSGSTGKPKGVLIEHHSVINTVLSCIDRLQVTSQNRILQISSFSFDVSVAEWCMALLSGASLYLMNKDIFSPEVIIDALKSYKITTIILASSILAVLPKEELPDLKVIAPGGEPCGQSIVQFWSQDRLLFNIYGITEAAICSTMSKFSPECANASDIGKPLPNTQVYILDRNLCPVPIGVMGEIYIGGSGLARGYLNQPELTNEKFIFYTASLAAKDEKIRLYRTGDYGRWLSTGNIECLGRKDEQVKIRGFRVELSEVEQVLEEHPSVKKAVAVIREMPVGKQLHAYILPVQEQIDLDEIKLYSQAQLPNYMVPARFYQLNELLLTANGKIDKQKIFSLVSDNNISRGNHNVLASSNLEGVIEQIAQSLLQRNDISVDANFLDLGFDSLSLLHFSSKLSDIFKRKIDVVELFTYANIKTLSAYIGSYNNNQTPIKNKHRQGTTVKANRVVFTDEH